MNLDQDFLERTNDSTLSWLEQSPVCSKIVDLDFKLRYMSSAGAKDLKIEHVEEYYGQPYPLDFYPKSFKSQMTRDLEKVIATETAVTQEASIKNKDGNIIWYRSTLIPLYTDNSVDQILVVSVNISKQKEAEAELRIAFEDLEEKYQHRTEELSVSNERYKLALQGASDGLWDWNLETNGVYYSPRWKSMLGYKEEQLGNTISVWEELVHPDDKDRVLKHAEDYLSKNSDTFEIEMRMMHKSGQVIDILSRAFSVSSKSDGIPARLIGTHIDITERVKAENFNRRTSEILEMIAIGKPASEIYDAIALMYEARHPGLRCSMLELENGTLLHGGAPSMPKEYCDAVHGLKNGPEVGSCGTSTYWGKRCVVENIDTDPKWAEIKHVALPHGMRCCWSEPIKNSEGKVLGAFGMYYNHPALPNTDESNDLTSAGRLAGIIMERDHHQKRIRELAFTDQLTGLASRAYFYLYLGDLINTSKQHSRSFSILYIDLDNFKDVNDSLGHDCGDTLLKTIADRLIEESRDVDFIARLSGDEFCLIIENNSDPYLPANIAKRCLDSVAKPTNISGRTCKTSCSAGISHYPKDGDTTSSLLKAADTAMYSAKLAGRNRYAYYEPKLTKEAEYRYQFEQYLREAIDNKQLTIVFQPQVDINTQEIIGVEALSRWHHPTLGHVSPVEFIDVAERIGMIKPLTEQVLLNACRQALTWMRHGFPALRVAVNISPSHFLDKGIVSLVQRVIEETGIDPCQLELEVTESVVQTNPKNLLVFSELKSLGVLLAIDDFGTGYSSFASLKHIEVDFLKIDKFFIDGILTDKKSELLVSSMIEIGHNLGHVIIAEGVEEAEQMTLLQQMNCDTIQGYLFSKPVDNHSILKLLKSGFVKPWSDQITYNKL